MASVSWQYRRISSSRCGARNARTEASSPIATGVDLAKISLHYAIEGDPVTMAMSIVPLWIASNSRVREPLDRVDIHLRIPASKFDEPTLRLPAESEV